MRQVLLSLIFLVLGTVAFIDTAHGLDRFERVKDSSQRIQSPKIQPVDRVERKPDLRRDLRNPEMNLRPQRFEQETCRPVGKSTAMRAASSRAGGKVLSAYLNSRSNPPVYKVKVINESGRVRYVMVNACNGMVIG